MNYKYRFLVRALCATTKYQPETVTALELVTLAKTVPECFPRGLTFEQAQYMLDHPDEVVSDEDVVEDA